ncbi:ABC transporter ATP-binding protein [Rhodovulum sp. P5]|uniref:ABC transporter ATP-binding protein n=1 Tax=Rhodovulum sp. P5 TaxID=1564506 RepID=UPI0009DA83C1|nr:ABC transporter ATP-binding protein [Rhodovulum sp. P5]
MATIDLHGIEKRFGETAVLKGIDLSIQKGEFVTLVGPSGCGKSTLLRILAGLETPDGGRVEIAGRDVTAMRPADRNLAMVFQSYALYPHLTVRENMMTPLKLRDLSRAARLPLIGPAMHRDAYRALMGQVQQTAEILKIEALLDRKPGQLSGGQRQRAALGRAMVRNPVAFLMDEPLSNLDAALRVHMRAELSELHRRLATTFVYVTHDQAEALTLSNRMAVMMGGRILQFGKPADIYARPDTLEVARFIGSPAINVIPGEIGRDGRLGMLGKTVGTVPRAAPGPVMLGLRPEHLRLDPRGAFGGTVTHRENLGPDLFLHLGVEGCDTPVILRTTPDRAQQSDLGQPVRISVDPAQLHCFGAEGRRLDRSVAPAREVA